MQACPVCGVEHEKHENTPYCQDHKKTTDALFRQLKKDVDRASSKKDKKEAQALHTSVVTLSKNKNEEEGVGQVCQHLRCAVP